MRSVACYRDSIIHTARKLAFHRECGERIRAARKAAGLSQDALAERMGLAKGTLSHVEDGTALSLYVVALVAQSLDNVTLEELVPIIEDRVG
jgi:transcriptional regulator with XRE-family HTH domain